MSRVADLDIDVPSTLDRLGIETFAERGEWADILCPLHEETNPSFSINLQHGGWVCRHGDIKGQLLDLVVRVKGVSRGEAADWVRRSTSVNHTTLEILKKLFSSQPDPEDKRVILEWAECYDGLSPKRMAEYWFDRGFTAQTMKIFGVRFDEDEGSLIWPVRDESANLLGFVKRRVPPFSGKAKYLYPKGFSRVLFPLDHFEGAGVILVEGPLDALWLHQNGFTGALAVLGSGLTKSQASWVQTHAERVIVAFDNDREGREGRRQVTRQLAGLYTKVVNLPAGAKDVQDLDGSLLRKIVKEARPALISSMEGIQ